MIFRFIETVFKISSLYLPPSPDSWALPVCRTGRGRASTGTRHRAAPPRSHRWLPWGWRHWCRCRSRGSCWKPAPGYSSLVCCGWSSFKMDFLAGGDLSLNSPLLSACLIAKLRLCVVAFTVCGYMAAMFMGRRSNAPLIGEGIGSTAYLAVLWTRCFWDTATVKGKAETVMSNSYRP